MVFYVAMSSGSLTPLLFACPSQALLQKTMLEQMAAVTMQVDQAALEKRNLMSELAKEREKSDRLQVRRASWRVPG